jgi:hypothetical protein
MYNCDGVKVVSTLVPSPTTRSSYLLEQHLLTLYLPHIYAGAAVGPAEAAGAEH